jgi:hypothetical protein
MRIAEAADLGFMAKMLVEAWYPPSHEPRPSPAAALRDTRAGRHLRD